MKAKLLEHEGFRAGTIYVRHAGSVEPAGPAEIDALNARAGSRATPRVAVDVVPAPAAAPLRCVEISEEAIERWLDARRAALLRSVESKPSSIDPLSTSYALMTKAAFIGGILDEPDERTEEQYRRQVEAHVAACREVLHEVATDVIRKRELSVLRLRLLNLTETNFPGLEVAVHFPGRVAGIFGRMEKLPPKPRPFGQPKRGSWSEFPASIGPIHVPSLGLGLRLPVIENGGSVKITYVPLDLRPREEVDLLPVHLAVAVAASQLSGTWTATSLAADGVAEGAIDVPVENERLALSDLLPDP